ncbi:MAG: hypothetical protein AAGH76_14375 [Pseudomonadota bacterium]
MFESIVDSVRGLVARFYGTNRPQHESLRSSSVQRVMRRPAANGTPTPVANNNGVDSAAHGASETSASSDDGLGTATPRRVISRGNNKNVYVIATPDLDENEALRRADELAIDTGTLETVEENGFDPYNSGSYSKRKR